MTALTTVAVIGAGAMGAGIAQTAAGAGHHILLFDTRQGAAAAAIAGIADLLDRQVAKGKLTSDLRDDQLTRLLPAERIEDLAAAGLVIEAIVEKLEPKRQLFKTLETIVAADTIIASNTSSLSITALASGLNHPERLAGLHFFNPVPLMKLVEVIAGIETSPAVIERLTELSRGWGKTPVSARSTPGFIVNRIARPYYAEALAILEEGAATPEQIDACLRGAGFRMGPCELMDLIGHDVNYAVTESVFNAFYGDRRFLPSGLQRELVEGGWLGRKFGWGILSLRR